MNWADRVFPAMTTVRVDRNKNILSSWHLGIFMPIFWLPTVVLEIFYVGLMNIAYGLCQIVLSLANALLLELPMLLLFGAAGMIRRSTAEEMARMSDDEDDED